MNRRPFAPAVVRRAREIVDGYQIVVRVEDGKFIGRGQDSPECIGIGPTAAAAVDQTRAAMVAGSRSCSNAAGPRRPPRSNGPGRSRSISHLSAEEKMALDTAARQHGFRGAAACRAACRWVVRAGGTGGVGPGLEFPIRRPEKNGRSARPAAVCEIR